MPPEAKITPGMIAAGLAALSETHIYDCENMNQASPEEAVTAIYQAMLAQAQAEPYRGQ